MVFLLVFVAIAFANAAHMCSTTERAPPGFHYMGGASQGSFYPRSSFPPGSDVQTIRAMEREAERAAKGEGTACCVMRRNKFSLMSVFCPFEKSPMPESWSNEGTEFAPVKGSNLFPSWVRGPCGASTCDKKWYTCSDTSLL